MDEDLKDLYEAELKHLRTHADEFAAREPFRRIAGRIGLSPNAEFRDPFVEWLLQGYAFLAARVRRRLEAEFPRFTQNLLSIVYPHIAAPTPSVIVAEFAMRPDPGLLEAGALVPRETRLTMIVRGGKGAARRNRRVIFSTGRATRLWPVETTAVKYLPDPAAVASAGASRPAPAAVLVTLSLTPPEADVSKFGADELDLFLGEDESGGAALFEALALACARCETPASGKRRAVAVTARPLGLESEAPLAPGAPGEDPPDPRDALLPYGPRSFEGWRLMHEFFALPARFHFIRVSGLRRALAGRDGASLSLLFLLDRPFPNLAGRLGKESARPNCLPAVNLFRHSADDVAFDARRVEHPILPDRGDPTGYEVHSVLAVRGVTRDGERVTYRPFFAADGFGARSERGRRYFHMTRRARSRPAIREERDDGLDAYVGSDAYVSLVDEGARPVPADLKALSLDLLCTNRHLAAFALIDAGAARRLASDLDLGWREIRVAAGPSSPRPRLPEGRRLWDAISHLSLNHLSLVDGEGEPGRAAAALRQLMRLYAPARDATAMALVDSLRDVSARPTVRRIAPLYDRRGDMAAPMAYARGLEITLVMDEGAKAGPTLAAILDRVLAGHAEANSFVEVVLRSPDGVERARFAPRSGTRIVA